MKLKIAFLALFWVIFIPLGVSAQNVVISQQLASTTNIKTGSPTGFQWTIGNGITGGLENAEIKVRASMPSDGTRQLYAEISCYNDASYSTLCSGAHTFQGEDVPVVNNVLQNYILPFSTTTYYITSEKYYKLRVFAHIGTNYIFTNISGTSTPNTCTAGCSGTPFYTLSVLTPPQTRVLSVNFPASGETATTTTFNFSFDVFVNQFVNQYEIKFYNAFTNELERTDTGVINAEGTSTFTESVTLPAGSHNAVIRLNDTTTGSTYSGYDIETGEDYVFTRFFSVIYNQFEGLIGATSTDFQALSALATTTCSFSNISGCFQNALVFLFFPNEQSLNNFTNLKKLVQDKPPFAYIFITTSALNSLNDNEAGNFEIETEENILDNVFTPLDIALAGILWFLFALWFFNRIRHMEL